MAQLLLSDVGEETIRRLEKRAAVHGRSAEEEHRAILERALAPASEPPAAVARQLQKTTVNGGPEDAALSSRMDGWIPVPPNGHVRLC
ncbi:FitA-like ribbon-helix-helix domain-containing protein [Sabulicella glaciei]|uniref:Antitoxin FitA-like ribbon-helix-helix domain-containing protein n=1 Tax=Sabulicella glaciei TaxID=2984948 RepID=A0ABT3P280_9PROT|nr:hypothetical protein [Roseococcus sp. MDT2-1-1]MCW8088501.1 hypothetical protein [Roseococcus sp. MDT2-1-1]